MKLTLIGSIKIEGKFDTYFIRQDEYNNLFYITSERGYNGYEGKGDKTLKSAISQVQKLLVTDAIDNA